MSDAPSRTERGFTLVEVIVAAVIIGIVVASAAGALRGAMNTESHAKVTSRGRSIAQAVERKLQADTTWMVACQASTAPGGTCAIPVSSVISASDRLLSEPDGTIVHTVTITAQAVDLPADNLGTADLDSRPIDVWKLHVVNKVTGAIMPTAGVIYTADGIVNPGTRGRTGVVRIRMCAIDGQVDERMGTGLCTAASGPSAAPTHSVPLDPPVAGTCTGAAITLICNPWNAAEVADNGLAERYTDVRLRPMAGASVTLTGPLASSSTTVSATMAASGYVDVRDLAPGQYRINIPNPMSWGGSQWTGWSSHSVPSSGTLIVEKGGLREATIMMRPAMPAIRMQVQTWNRTNPFAMVMEPSARFAQTVRLNPVPAGRAALERGTAQNGWTSIRVGDSNVLMQDSHPGLYSPGVLHYPRGDISTLVGVGKFVWIDPSGTTLPATFILRQDYCNAAARHAIVISKCGTLRWCWIGPTFVGECNDNPTPTGAAATGVGGA